MAQPVYLARAEVVVIIALVGLAVVAWLFTDLEMAGMDAGPGTDPGA
jgi:predicted metal-binding membrane protein